MGVAAQGNGPVDRLGVLIRRRWLPAFVAANPGTSVDAYHESPVLPQEAAGFLRALDSGVLLMAEDQEGRQTGLGRLPGYRAYYCYPLLYRPVKALPDVYLWREWLTHAAVAARLHLDFGYPKHVLALEEDAFDVVVHGRQNEPLIAVEVKKSAKELTQMVERLHVLSHGTFDPWCGEKLSNSDKKYRGLLALRPPFFWAVSPELEAVFDVTYSHDPSNALLIEREVVPRYAVSL
jgi:hypothetical protein